MDSVMYNNSSPMDNLLNLTTELDSNYSLLDNNRPGCRDIPLCWNFQVNLYSVSLVIATFGMVGNILSTIILHKQASHTSNIVLLQLLSATDGCLMLITMASSIVQLYYYLADRPDPGMSSSFTALAVLYDVLHYISIFLLVYLATDRYIAICFPLHAIRWCTASTAYKAFGGIVLASLCITAYRAYILVGDIEELHPIIYSSISMSLRYFIPIITLIFLNTSLVLAIRRSMHMADVEADLGVRRFCSNNQPKHSKSVTVNLIVVVLVFLLCGTCRGIYWILDESTSILAPYPMFRMYFDGVSYTLMVINSAINFFVYCLFYKRFRDMLYNVVFCARHTARHAVTVKMSTTSQYHAASHTITTIVNTDHPK